MQAEKTENDVLNVVSHHNQDIRERKLKRGHSFPFLPPPPPYFLLGITESRTLYFSSYLLGKTIS